MKIMYCMFLHAEVYFARIWVCCPHYHIANQMPSVITGKIERSTDQCELKWKGIMHHHHPLTCQNII